MMLFLVALDTDFDVLFEHCRVFPADRSETRSGVEYGDGLNCFQSDSNAGDVSG